MPLYEAIYKYQAPQLRPAFQAPEAITDDNYEKYLGHRESVPDYPRYSVACSPTSYIYSYYDSYLTYFHDVVLRHNFSSVLEQYIFSYDANFPEAGAPRHMVNRLVARLLHPIIYVGYGLEFNIPGLVAEGDWKVTHVGVALELSMLQVSHKWHATLRKRQAFWSRAISPKRLQRACMTLPQPL